MSNFNAGNP